MSSIATCPKCGMPVDEEQKESRCLACGRPLPEDITSLLRQRELVPDQPPQEMRMLDSQQVVASTSYQPPPASSTGPRVMTRYKDAYRVGSAVVEFGNLIKWAGAIVGGIIALVGISQGGAVALGAMVLAAISGGLFWLLGVIVAAQGQILIATLDTSVSTSPFLSDEQRLAAMGLPNAFAGQPAAPRPVLKPGEIACTECGRPISSTDRQICRDRRRCEYHL